MSEQRKKANEFMRRKLGDGVDAAAAQAGLRVLKDDDGGGEDNHDSVPWIELPGTGRQLRSFAREMGAVLAEQNIFRREKYPVAVNVETGMIEVIDADEFCSLVEEYAVTYKLKAVKGGYENEPTTMTVACSRGTLKAKEFIYALRRLERVNLVRMPVMRSNGQPELLPEGYDDETKTFTLKSDIAIDLNLLPAEGAKIVREYLAEFPFTDARSLAVAVAAMVALYSAQMQELTAARMSFVFRSNVEGAGKSLLAQFAITPPYGLAEGQPLAGREELRKLLDATALQGSPYLFLDNLTGHVASELLDSYLTTPIWTGRLLGTPKIFKAPANAMLLITGNGITLSPDISRRSLVCNLKVTEADPEQRQPKRVITPQFLAKASVRGDLLSALWAMIRGWAAIKPRPVGARRIRSFEEWSDFVGGIVACNGFGDALEKPKDEETANPQEVHKRNMVEALAEMLPEGGALVEFRFDEVLEVCRDKGFFDWIVDGKMITKKEKLDDGSVIATEIFQATKDCASALGKIFGQQMAGQHYSLKDRRRVLFAKRGEGRHRRYQIILQP